MDHDLSRRSKPFIAALGIAVIIYCVSVLGFVGTAPDIRLRGLLSDSDQVNSFSGMVVRDIVDAEYESGTQIQIGDVLQSVRDRPIRSFLDFTLSLQALRNATIESGGRVPVRSTLADDQSWLHPPLVEVDEDGSRFVTVSFLRPSTGESFKTRLMVKSLPLSEVLVSFIWMALQLGIFSVSALAAWHRPFDRSARLFFAMCAVTMAAFVGGYHWWVLESSFLLNAPFIVCAVLVPAVSLHFFITYPRRLFLMERHAKPTVAVIYTVPTLAAILMLGLWMTARLMTSDEMSNAAVYWVVGSLQVLRWCIYGYLVFAALCFCVMLVALANEYFTAPGPIEKNQVKWMFRAGLVAAVPIAYTLYLAIFHRTDFALGSARLPMFFASLSFMLAYSIGIARFKLMLVDEFVSKGMLYQVATQGLTVLYAFGVALIAFMATHLNVTAALPGKFQQILSVGVVLTFTVVVMSWSRDRLQQMIDRRFYREKYQLDKALQRVNRSLDSLADRHSLGQRMLTSCREVLGTKFAAIYLREHSRRSFQLLAIEGTSGLPEQFELDDESAEILKRDSAVTGISMRPADDLTELGRSLRRFRCEMVHAVTAEGEIDGLVILGRRNSGAGYSAEDLTFLSTLGQFTLVALRSVKLHQDFARLNDELQSKATKIDEQKRQIAMMQSELNGSNAPKVPTDDAELRRDMIKGNSPAIQEVLETVRKVAASESTVLVQGASGTGKELLAQAIHENSVRRNGPLVRVHCAALSPSLLESELFGHVKGAFTGAHRDRVGRFEMANGGTLFLDEIGDISLETQIKLLRVLQTRSFEPVGGTRTVNVDVRLITATHQNLQKLISEGRFREDLYYRLNVVRITLPTLSERKEDIFELSLHFLRQAAQRANKRVTHIDADALDAMLRHTWPGNIRELENVLERAVVLCESDHISLKELPSDVLETNAFLPTKSDTMPGALSTPNEANLVAPPQSVVSAVRATSRNIRQEVESNERLLLERALRDCGGNKAEAARKLGIPRSTFFSKLKKAGMQ